VDWWTITPTCYLFPFVLLWDRAWVWPKNEQVEDLLVILLHVAMLHAWRVFREDQGEEVWDGWCYQTSFVARAGPRRYSSGLWVNRWDERIFQMFSIRWQGDSLWVPTSPCFLPYSGRQPDAASLPIAGAHLLHTFRSNKKKGLQIFSVNPWYPWWS